MKERLNLSSTRNNYSNLRAILCNVALVLVN